MAIVTKLACTTIDCPEPAALLDFYRRLTGWQQIYDTPEFSAISPDGSPFNWIGFQRIDDYLAPDWPGQDRAQQIHLDFFAPDLDAAQRGAEEIGARAAALQPQPDQWRVMLDPIGHPFCICLEPDRQPQ
jgi:catechol 2,3-dioxygenase-like lactoylglutathione lyase family enzyme